jgi:hypothetical protein
MYIAGLEISWTSLHLFAPPVLQTLARIMREDMKKSIDLCINVVSVFFAVSNFSQLHQLIMDNQVRVHAQMMCALACSLTCVKQVQCGKQHMALALVRLPLHAQIPVAAAALF